MVFYPGGIPIPAGKALSLIHIYILHFFVSMCRKMDMDAEELYERYLDKNKENFDRQNGLSAKKGYELGEA